MTSLPATARRLTITKLSNKFREVTKVEEFTVEKPPAGHILAKTKFVGINASDIIFSNGGYDPNHRAPMTAGLEGIGEVVAVGDGVDMKVGQAVVFLEKGSFSEYVTVDAKKAIPVPSVDPGMLCIVLSGLTASIALEVEGDLKPGKKVLVTAAAGGTGQFAVQIAKQAGCHVIGTCSSPEKSEFLKGIGCDRVVNYRNEDLGEVLSKEYPGGIDVVYESIGKNMFDAALLNLAVKGRLIVIGQISNYEKVEPFKDEAGETVSKIPIAMTLLRKSASVRGFFLPLYAEHFPKHIGKLAKQYAEGTLKIAMDKGEGAPSGPFVGVGKTVDAVEYMYSRANIGKIIVQI